MTRFWDFFLFCLVLGAHSRQALYSWTILYSLALFPVSFCEIRSCLISCWGWSWTWSPLLISWVAERAGLCHQDFFLSNNKVYAQNHSSCTFVCCPLVLEAVASLEWFRRLWRLWEAQAACSLGLLGSLSSVTWEAGGFASALLTQPCSVQVRH